MILAINREVQNRARNSKVFRARARFRMIFDNYQGSEEYTHTYTILDVHANTLSHSNPGGESTMKYWTSKDTRWKGNKIGICYEKSFSIE